MIAGVPFAGVLAVIVLVLGIAQVPALLVTLPVIAYVWVSGDYGTGPAVVYTVLLFVGGMLDNVLKPLLLGRGVDAPMPVVLLGALGGLATPGILGMFIGATVLAWATRSSCGGWRPIPTLGDGGGESPIRRPEPMRAMPSTGSRGDAYGPGRRRCCSAAAPRWARTSSGPRALAGRLDGGSLESLRAEQRGARASADADEWWRNFNDPVLDGSSPRRSASIPTCAPPACASWKRAPSSASPAARSIRRCSRRPAQVLGVGEQRSSGRDTSAVDCERRASASAGKSTSGASSGAASRPRTPATWPASPSTTTCRC